MSDLPYNRETNTTMLSPREKWIAYTKGTHFNFIRGSDLGPLQQKRAMVFYRELHWEGATFNSEYGPGFKSVTRILTAEPDEARMAKIYELIDAAWAGIGWAISRKTFKTWANSMEAILPVIKAMRPSEKAQA